MAETQSVAQCLSDMKTIYMDATYFDDDLKNLEEEFEAAPDITYPTDTMKRLATKLESLQKAVSNSTIIWSLTWSNPSLNECSRCLLQK